MMDERSELTKKFAAIANGYQRPSVVNAGGNMILNAIRQAHKTLSEAEKELDDLVERMKAALRENHYTDNGDRRHTIITVPHLDFKEMAKFD